MTFTADFEVRWADLDVNWHLRNTAYADFGTHTRLRYLLENGFPPSRFQQEGFGPVIFREESRYLKEARLGQRLTLDFQIAGLSDDGDHWEIEHRVSRDDGELAAVLRVEGAWLDLTRRKLRRPPRDLAEALRRLPRTEDFRHLKAVAKR